MAPVIFRHIARRPAGSANNARRCGVTTQNHSGRGTVYRRIFALIAVTVGLWHLGCGAAHIDRVQTFEPRDLPRQATGTGRVAGTAYYIDATGDLHLPVLGRVRMGPDTAYLREEAQQLSAQLPVVLDPPLDPRAAPWLAKTDDRGHFEFTDLPAGKFLIIAEYSWLYGRGYATHHVALGHVTLADGETATVRLD